jgi:hypothetical protein
MAPFGLWPKNYSVHQGCPPCVIGAAFGPPVSFVGLPRMSFSSQKYVFTLSSSLRKDAINLVDNIFTESSYNIFEYILIDFT